MPTQKKFLDEDGLIQLLQEIESLDETNIKDVHWSSNNSDLYPTIVFKVGDDNGAAHSERKITFKGDTTSPAPSNATTRSITLTIDNVDKTITYYDTTSSAGITYTNASDSSQPSAATDVKTALDRVITKLASIVGTDDKVKQTAQTGSTGLPILTATSGTPSDGASAEAGYDTDFKFTPSSNTLVVKAATSSASGVTITPSSIKVGTTASNGAAELTPSQLKVGSATLTSTAYSGKATQTETDLNTVAANKGSDMVAYSSSDSVKDALDDIYSQIGSGGGENSLTSRIETLENGGNLVEGTNVTLTKDTTNHTVTISAVDEKVTQQSDTSTDSYLPLLLANNTTPTSPGVSKYNSDIIFKPSTSEFKVQKTTSNGGMLRTSSVAINDGVVTISSTGNTTVTLGVNGFSGNSATATLATNAVDAVTATKAYGDEDTIQNTYATKAALDALTSKWTGQFVVLKNAGVTQERYTALVNILEALNDNSSQTLPSSSDLAKLDFGYIYLLETGDGSNVFDEYIKVQIDATHTSVEKIGTTDAGVDVVTIPTTGTNSVHSYFVQYVLEA